MASDSFEKKETAAARVLRYDDVHDGDDLTTKAPSYSRDGRGICDSIVNGTVGDDGLIDVRLNSVASLFQAFQLQNGTIRDKSSRCTSASEQGKTDNFEPPRLNIVIQVVGSLGDVQPFVSIARLLQQSGHSVRLATHPVFRRMIESHAIEFFDIGGDPAELMAFMVRNPGLLPSSQSAFNGDLEGQRTVLRGLMERCWKSCFEPGMPPGVNEATSVPARDQLRPFVADAIIANPPAFAHIHCAERLGIPLHMVFTMPWTPTRAFPHPLARLQSPRMNDKTMNQMSYVVIDTLIWQGLRREINSFRWNTLGLEPLDPIWAPAMMARLGIPTSYCWSPKLLPKPDDWTEEVHVTGFCRTDDGGEDYNPSAELLDFLHRGSAPIYVGFGSIVVKDPEALTMLILAAIDRAGVRAVVARGSSKIGLGRNDTKHVHFIGDCPHSWLFEHVSCVVHHGGSGTTSSGLKAGKPTVTVPFFGDQFFWANRVHAAGAGPSPLPYKELTADKLAARITSAFAANYSHRARMLAAELAAEDGAVQVRENFHGRLHFEIMRCDLAPNRCAAWRIKQGGTIIHLSSLAAAILVAHKLLDTGSMSLIRSVNYNIDPGPMEPVSGAAAAITGLLHGFAKGVAETVTSLDTVIDHSTEDRSLSERKTKNYSTINRHRVSSAKIKRAIVADVPSITNVPLVTGCGNAALTIVRSPMTFSLALAKGAHNAPLLWRDTTVREVPKVTGIRSGVVIGCKELALGAYDGIVGLVKLPLIGARENGFLGAITGVGKGLASAPMKFFSAAAAPVGYPLKGLDVRVGKFLVGRGGNAVERAMIARGEYELLQAPFSQQQMILKRWEELVNV